MRFFKPNSIRTAQVEKAIAYIESMEFKMDINEAKTDSKGKFKTVYFEEEFGGFAVHLVQRG